MEALPTWLITKEGGWALAIRNEEVTLAPQDSTDPLQRWVKDEKWGTTVKDQWGFPAFALYNTKTGLAMKHAKGAKLPVQLTKYNPDVLDKSVLWTQGEDLGGGFTAIRMANDVTLNVAFDGSKQVTLKVTFDKQVYEGTEIGLWEWNQSASQQWKIIPNPPPARVITKAGPDYSLAIHNEKVTLAPKDSSDPFQRWVKDEKWGSTVKDQWGFPAFALYNTETGLAMKHAEAAKLQVQLTKYNPDVLDESVLWTEAEELEDGFRAIRMANDVTLNVDAFEGSKGVYDGIEVGVWSWNQGPHQQWKIIPN